MGQHFTRTEPNFLTDCERQLSQLDEMLLGTVSSVDALHLSFKQLVHQLDEMCTENTDESESTSKQRWKESMKLTKKILSSLESGLCHQNTVLLQEISQFARMIRLKSDKTKSITTSIPTLKDMKIDEYLSKGKLLPLAADTAKPVEKTNDRHVERASVVKSNEGADRVIAALKEDKTKLLNEMKMLENENQTKSEQIKELKQKVSILEDENRQLLKDKEDLKIKVKKLEQESLQIAPVQLYYQKRNDQMGFVMQEILAQLNVKERFGNKKLAFITCEQSSDILTGLPLLVLCINASRLGTDARKAIQGISRPENSALVILHHKDEHALPEQGSERVLVEPEFKAMAGIFDIAFLSAKGIYVCDRNTDAISGMVKFIQEVLEKNPLKVKIM